MPADTSQSAEAQSVISDDPLQFVPIREIRVKPVNWYARQDLNLPQFAKTGLNSLADLLPDKNLTKSDAYAEFC